MQKTALAPKPILVAAASVLIAACSSEVPTSFSQEVKPILDQNCLSCHQQGGAGYEASGFSMTSYENVMKGTSNGPMVIGGDVEGSNLLVLMEGRADPSISMPHGSLDPIAQKDIDTIKNWVRQGAKNN